MSDSYEMIVVIVVFFFIILRVRSTVNKATKQAERMKKEGEVNKQVGITASSSFAQAAGSAIQKREDFASQAMGRPSSPINYPAAQGSKPAANTRPVTNNRPGQKSAARPQSAAASKQAAEESLSTTEMLAQKAKMDQIEHQKEKMEQKRHEQQYYRNYNYAKRYLLGDPVAPTEKLIYCPNCAAENLIKIHENPKKYNCYFCREKLDV